MMGQIELGHPRIVAALTLGHNLNNWKISTLFDECDLLLIEANYYSLHIAVLEPV